MIKATQRITHLKNPRYDHFQSKHVGASSHNSCTQRVLKISGRLTTAAAQSDEAGRLGDRREAKQGEGDSLK
jgi:hypothetical protein